MKKVVSILLSFLLFISMTVSIFASTDLDNSVLIDNLLEDRAELIAQGKYDKLDIIDKQLEVLGVKKLTPQEVEELNKDDVVPYITKPVSNNVTWLSSRQDYTYNGTTYEIQTLIAQPNQNNSNLKIIGSRALASTYKWKAGAMNAISVLAEATYGELTGMSRVFTVYDTLNGMISGITRTTEISAAEIVYSYAHTTTASFKYIKVKGEADDKQHLAYISTKGTTAIGYQYPQFIYSGGTVEPNIIQGSRTINTTPDGYNSNLEAVKAYVKGISKKVWVENVKITGIETKSVSHIYPVCPEFLAQIY